MLYDGYEDGISIDLQNSIESLQFIDSYNKIESALADTKLRMCKKLSIEYGFKSGIKTINARSIENLCIKSTEGVITSFVNSVFNIVTTVIKAIINFIGKIAGFILNVILGLAKRIIHRLTAPKKIPKEKQNKFLQYLKGYRSKEDYFSLEFVDTNNSKMEKSINFTNDEKQTNSIDDIIKILDIKVTKINSYVMENKNDFIKSFYNEVLNTNDVVAMCNVMQQKEQKIGGFISKNIPEAYDSILKTGESCVKSIDTHKNIDNSIKNNCIEKSKVLTKFLDEVNVANNTKPLPKDHILQRLVSMAFQYNFSAVGKKYINKLQFAANNIVKENIEPLKNKLQNLLNVIESKMNSSNNDKLNHLKDDLNIFKKSVQNFSNACMKSFSIYSGVKNINVKVFDAMTSFIDAVARTN